MTNDAGRIASARPVTPNHHFAFVIPNRASGEESAVLSVRSDSSSRPPFAKRASEDARAHIEPKKRDGKRRPLHPEA